MPLRFCARKIILFKAIDNLVARNRLDPVAIVAARNDHLAGWLRPIVLKKSLISKMSDFQGIEMHYPH